LTSSSHTKMLKQLKHKPAKLKRFKKYNSPRKRSCGRTVKKCIITGNMRGMVTKYGVDMTRHAFRTYATKLGFKKYS